MRTVIKLRNLRKQKDLTQQELADILGISRQSVIAVETGRFMPSIDLALEIANFFNLSLDELFNFNKPAICADRREEIMKKENEWLPKEIKPFRSAMDRLFDDFFGSTDQFNNVPQIEIAHKNNELVIKSEIPGVEPNDIEINITNEGLSISGEKKLEQEDKDKEYYHREITYGKFYRTIDLPHLVDADKAKAKFKNGILTITVPITRKSTETKKIKIETE